MWVTIWANLASMKGLRDLRVKLNVLNTSHSKWENMTANEAASLLDPVMRLTTPTFFEITVPFPFRVDEDLWKALPCQVQRCEYVDANFI